MTVVKNGQVSEVNGALTDSFGRVVTDLRISVTDRCDLRCAYCMPEEGLDWTPTSDLLTFDEIEYLARIFMSLGIRSIRLTGGEPLLRRDLPTLVGRLAALKPADLSLTTNGTLLSRHAFALKEAGLQRVNISLDSLDQHGFANITRRDRLPAVLKGVQTAIAAGLLPLKINCVVLRGVNESEVISFATFARTVPCHVRFIEYLPLDADHRWSAEQVVPSSEILKRINSVYGLTAEGLSDNQPATVYRFADGNNGSVGFISSVTQPFCATCDRVRLTADGQLRVCLFSTEDVDLRGLLRNGSDINHICETIRDAVSKKKAGHGIGTSVFVRPRRSMSMIGG